MRSNSVLCLRSSAFLIVDSTFHGQCHVRLEMEGVNTVFRSRACYLVPFSTGLCSKGSCLRIIYNFGTASYQMHSVQIGPEWRLCSAQTWSCEVVGSHQFAECSQILCCVWEAPLFWLLIQHFMANVMLRLEKQGVSTVFRSRACYLVHLSTGLCSKGSCLRSIYNFGTAVTRCHRLNWF